MASVIPGRHNLTCTAAGRVTGGGKAKGGMHGRTTADFTGNVDYYAGLCYQDANFQIIRFEAKGYEKK